MDMLNISDLQVSFDGKEVLKGINLHIPKGKTHIPEIEYLMARGLDEEEAVSTIVRGFLSVKIEGLPPALEEELDRAIQESGKGL